MERRRRLGALGLVLAFTSSAMESRAFADDATPGFPEPVIQWDVQKGETCEDIAKTLYGDALEAHLVMRYNHVACTRGAPLKAGQTLVMPAKVTAVPSAVLTSLVPSVRAKAPGASWSEAAPGMPLSTNANVNTMDKASASIHFIDRTKVFLSENTLVVIFGTASQSAVSKAIPPSVEVDSGEIRTALSALRGDPAEVSVPGGGRVSAASHDTVVERKGERTTVSVFDGLARVLNAGKSVEVPKNFGTRFVGQKPPILPRPLPPAPEWDKAPKDIVFAVDNKADLDASWKAVDHAKAYRVEVATDESFDALITREEVPEDTRAFHASGLPLGAYFLRVRAIDKEDFLGVATPPMVVFVVAAVASRGSATISGNELSLSPYATLALTAPSGALLSVDDGPFVPNPKALEIAETRPSHIALRIGKSDLLLTLRYRMPKIAIEAQKTQGDIGALRVTLSEIELGLVDNVRPWLRVRRRGALVSEHIDLTRTDAHSLAFAGSIPHIDDVERIDVLDGFGAVLGSRGGLENETAKVPPPSSRKPSVPRIGVVSQPFWPNPFVVDWWAPTAPNAGSVGFALEHGFRKGSVNGQGRAEVSGRIGPVGLTGSLFTDDLSSPTESHETAWLGARVRVLRLKNASLELAPIGRIGVGRGTHTVLGAAGFAIGGAAGRITWLGDVAFQFRPEAFPYLPSFVGGMTVDALSWLRPFATIDAFGAKIADKARGGGGLTLGAEAGHTLFGTLAARVSPFDAPLGGVSGMLSFGVRQEP